jgi:hypothetical protein
MKRLEIVLFAVGGALIAVVALIGLYRFLFTNPDMTRAEGDFEGYTPGFGSIILDILFWWIWW